MDWKKKKENLQLQNTRAFISGLLDEGNNFIACRDVVYFYFPSFIFLNSSQLISDLI